MDPKREAVLRRTEKLIPVGIGIGILAIIVLWVGYFVVAARESDGVGTQRYVWLALAIVATLAAPPILFFSIKNRLHLLRNGIEVSGTVASVSTLSKSGSRPVTYRYVVNSVEYTIKRDTPRTWADQYSEGFPVGMLVDPKNPKSAMVFDHGVEA